MADQTRREQVDNKLCTDSEWPPEGFTPLTMKEQKFAQQVIELGVLPDAYRAAFDCQASKPRTVNINACRLAKKPRVARRIAELNAEAVAIAQITREDILRGLKQEAGTAM